MLTLLKNTKLVKNKFKRWRFGETNMCKGYSEPTKDAENIRDPHCLSTTNNCSNFSTKRGRNHSSQCHYRCEKRIICNGKSQFFHDFGLSRRWIWHLQIMIVHKIRPQVDINSKSHNIQITILRQNSYWTITKFKTDFD